MSDHALFQINELVESTIEHSLNSAKAGLSQKKILQKQIDEVESYLTLDINEKELTAIYNQIKDKEGKLVRLQVELSKLQQERSAINAVLISKTAEFNRDVESYLQR